MSDLVEFLRARLDEDEATARAATVGPWTVNDPEFAEAIRSADGVDVVAGGRWGGEAPVFASTEDALHIARHDPARVLAETEAKRRLVDGIADAPQRARTSLPSSRPGMSCAYSRFPTRDTRNTAKSGDREGALSCANSRSVGQFAVE